MKPEIVQLGPIMEHVMAALDTDFAVHRLWEADDRGALLATAVNARGIASDGHTRIDGTLMDALPKLEVISSFGVGVDSIDLAAAAERNVIVANTPDVLNDDVANMAVALLLAVTRQICVGDRYVRSGEWLDGDMALTQSIVGKKLGILGLGRIGKAIAARAEVLGCSICYHGRREQPDQPYPYYADLTVMARECDFMVVICPGGAATRNLVDRAVLDALGPQGVLVNVARGSVVDEPELVAALEEGRLGGAGLDVFVDEPHVPEALFKLGNVVLQPHQGSGTIETRRAMGDLVVENLRAHFAGKPVLTPVA